MLSQRVGGFVLLMFLSSSLTSTIGATPAVPTPVDYEIYNGVLALMNFPMDDPRIAISEITLNSGCGEKSGNPVLMNDCGILMAASDPHEIEEDANSAMPQLSAKTWSDFNRRNGASVKLSDSLKSSWRHRVWNMSNPTTNDWKSPDGWLFFSQVGYNEDQKQALVYVLFFSYMKGVPTSGNFFLLQRGVSGSWGPVGRMTYMQTQ